MRTEIARLLGWPENRVRVKVPYLGGGFGAKLYIKLEALAVALSHDRAPAGEGRATMEEMFYTITKHPSTFRIKSGVDKDGRIIARKCEVFWNGGAYADIGPRVTQKSGFTAAGPYDIDNVSIDSYALYTNLTPAGALRGFGIPQLVWAYESHTDMIARALKLDPVEFRRKNMLRDGRPHATGTILKDAPIERCSTRIARAHGLVASRSTAAAAADQARPRLRHRHQGGDLADHVGRHRQRRRPTARPRSIAAPSTWARAPTPRWRRSSARCSTSRPRIVRVVPRDTDVTPYDMGTLGSRSLFHMGHAVRLAAEDARDKLAALAQGGRRAGGHQHPDRRAVPEAIRHAGRQRRSASGIYKPDYTPPAPGTGQSPNVTPFWMVAGAGAEVEVDTETGHVKITKLINVVDCGKAINPKSVETQISGAALMQLGFTMFEKMHIDGGQVTNASLADYKIPGFHDVPATLESHYVEHDQSNGPFGAKGVGEVATFCVSARRSPTPSTTPAACASWRCRSTPRRFIARSARRRASRWRTRDMTAARTITFTLNGAPVTADVKPHHNLVELLQTPVRSHRRARELRPGPVRLLHRRGQRQRGVGLPLSRAVRRRRRGDHHREPGHPRQAQPGAGGLHRGQRLPVRLLHARVHPDGDAAARRAIPTRPTIRSSTISPAISAAAPPIPRSWMR